MYPAWMGRLDPPQAGDEAEAAAGELGRRCDGCRASIAGEYYLLRERMICPQCARGIEPRRSSTSKTRGAWLFGAGTAAGVALPWYLAAAATGWPLAGLAIVAGAGIGWAVRRGACGRGGVRFQIIAAALVYAAFVVRFVPPVFGGIADAIKKEHASTIEESKKLEVPRPAAPAKAAQPEARAEEPRPPAPQTSILFTLKAYFVFAAIAWGLVLASPFMPGTSGFLAALWLAAGMALAFRLNRRARLRGPFTEIG